MIKYPGKIFYICIFLFLNSLCISQNTIFEFKISQNTYNYFNSTPKINGKSTEIYRNVYNMVFEINKEKNWTSGIQCSVLKRIRDKSVFVGALLGYESNDLVISRHSIETKNTNYILVKNNIYIDKFAFGFKTSMHKFNFNFTLNGGLNCNFNNAIGIMYEEDQYVEHTDLSEIDFKPDLGYFYGIEIGYDLRVYKNFYLCSGLEYKRNGSNHFNSEFFNLSYSIYSYFFSFKIKLDAN